MRHGHAQQNHIMMIIIGGGVITCDGLLFIKIHGITNVAVIEKGWLGGGMGRNTTIVRSNYLLRVTPHSIRNLCNYGKGYLKN